MGLLKMALVGGVAYVSLYGQREKVLGLTGMTTPEIAAFLVQVLLWTSLKIAFALLVLGGAWITASSGGSTSTTCG